MVDVDTFLTTLYVMVDDFCQSRPQEQHPGPEASLSSSEVVTLASSPDDGRASGAKETSTAMRAPV